MLSLVKSQMGERMTRAEQVQEIEKLGFSKGSANSIIDSAEVQFNRLDPVIERPGLIVSKWLVQALYQINLKKNDPYSEDIKELLNSVIYIGLTWPTWRHKYSNLNGANSILFDLNIDTPMSPRENPVPTDKHLQAFYGIARVALNSLSIDEIDEMRNGFILHGKP